jgi:UDPglucose 6-dehydrogenase
VHVTIFGVGYVGLVQAAALAEAGHTVQCMDIDVNKIRGLSRGEVPIYEPGLTEIVRARIASGHLSFTNVASEAVDHGKIQFIAVGTPSAADGGADLRYVMDVAGLIGRNMTSGKTVVVKSTVPVGTAEKVEFLINSELTKRGLSGLFCNVASNPEFLREGSAVLDCLTPDRIIVGADDDDTQRVLKELYASFGADKLIFMDRRSAELTKYAANAMLATKISFMNEIANIADRVGADIEQVRLGVGSDPRIGPHFLRAGIGYGGSCFPKDVSALLRTAHDLHFDAVVLSAVQHRNDVQKEYLFAKIRAHFDELAGRTFAVWGLSFKPETDDVRDAPSLVLVRALLNAGARVRGYDPKAMGQFRHAVGELEGLVYCKKKEDTLVDSDALVVATEWDEFAEPDFGAIRCALKYPIIFDGRNLYNARLAAEQGVTVHGVGRGLTTPSAAQRAVKAA